MARLGDVNMFFQQKPQKWEYKVVTSRWDLHGTNAQLYNLGREGWQLVTVTDEWWVFMRPLAEEEVSG